MATKNERLDLVRNIITELDKEINSATRIIEMIEKGEQYTGELQEILLLDWNSHLRMLENLKHFVIYKA
jgi:hypothetical protein